MTNKLYAGWLYCDRDEIAKLKELGVIGPMVWTYDNDDPITQALGKNGIIERCLCDGETMERLESEYREMWQSKYPHYKVHTVSYPYNQFSLITVEEAKRIWNWDYEEN